MHPILKKAASLVVVGGVSVGAWTVGSSLVADVQFAQAQQQV